MPTLDLTITIFCAHDIQKLPNQPCVCVHSSPFRILQQFWGPKFPWFSRVPNFWPSIPVPSPLFVPVRDLLLALGRTFRILAFHQFKTITSQWFLALSGLWACPVSPLNFWRPISNFSSCFQFYLWASLFGHFNSPNVTRYSCNRPASWHFNSKFQEITGNFCPREVPVWALVVTRVPGISAFWNVDTYIPGVQ